MNMKPSEAFVLRCCMQGSAVIMTRICEKVLISMNLCVAQGKCSNFSKLGQLLPI